MSWNPDRYLAFADHRTRPGLELMARIPDVKATRVVDLGCGTGHLTALLARRWAGAEVTGVDSSPEMLERARADHPRLRFVEGDIARWTATPPADVIYTNAALHWLDDHPRLFPRLMNQLTPGGALAVQMPDNWGEPTHTIPATILEEGGWPEPAVAALMRNRVHSPSSYQTWLAPMSGSVDQWETTYHQVLTGEDPVFAWVEGSVLGPVLGCLDTADRIRFQQACRAAYRAAYRPEADGTTILPFRRRFLVAARI